MEHDLHERLDRLRADGHDSRLEDVARLCPPGFKHINMLGRYAFTPPDIVARGELSSLRDPGAIASTMPDADLV